MNTQSLGYHLVAAVLRVALVVSLVGAGWSIYRGLPGAEGERSNGLGETALLIVLRPSQEGGAAVNIPVELYPVDLKAVQREFGFERRPGVRFEDFLKQRMNGKTSVKTRLDEHGEATIMLTPGKWWVYATLPGAQNIEWWLPVNVSGRRQIVELTAANVYARTKSF
ncbi:MAG TPA: hypothetical protein VF723_09315 [Pyrinomonadaceae bacterium]